MSTLEILSAICICLSAFIFSFSLQVQTKIKILFIQIFSSSLFLASYIFVVTIIPSAIGGVVTSSFEILRLIIFYFIEKNPKYNTKKWNLITAISFSIILTICIIVTWNSWYCILTLIATVLVTLALGNKNILLIKISFLIQAILLITYLSLIALWINAATQVYVLIFGIVGLIRYILAMKKENSKTENLVEQQK